MKKHSETLKKISSTKVNNLIKSERYKNIELQELDKLKHAVDLYNLYPEFAKNTNLSEVSFKEFYSNLIINIEDGKIISYAILDGVNNDIIGFFIFERIFPFIVNGHILVYPKYKNLYNALYASNKVINKLFKSDIKQIITYLKKENLKARLLLKKLGFYVWGTDENCVAYTLIKPKKKG